MTSDAMFYWKVASHSERSAAYNAPVSSPWSYALCIWSFHADWVFSQGSQQCTISILQSYAHWMMHALHQTLKKKLIAEKNWKVHTAYRTVKFNIQNYNFIIYELKITARKKTLRYCESALMSMQYGKCAIWLIGNLCNILTPTLHSSWLESKRNNTPPLKKKWIK